MTQDKTSTLRNPGFADRWYRFDRYEIKKGYIRPAPGATLSSYAPWQKFRNPAGKEGVRQPYHSLLQLPTFGDLERPGFSLKDADRARILEWCSQFGLLGMLLHRVELVVLPAEQRPSPLAQGDSPPRVAKRFVRTSRGWDIQDVLQMQSPTEPGAFLRRDLERYELTFEPLSETWARFFPSVLPSDRDCNQYPHPFSEAFWNQYSEPWWEFMDTVRMFREAVESIRSLGRRQNPTEDLARAVLKGEATIHALAAPTRPMLYSNRTGYHTGWACHSLLASFAMMAILDFSRARMLECANPRCRNLFVTKAVMAKYCGTRCRGTVQMRERRKRVAARKRDREG